MTTYICYPLTLGPEKWCVMTKRWHWWYVQCAMEYLGMMELECIVPALQQQICHCFAIEQYSWISRTLFFKDTSFTSKLQCFLLTLFM